MNANLFDLLLKRINKIEKVIDSRVDFIPERRMYEFLVLVDTGDQIMKLTFPVNDVMSETVEYHGVIFDMVSKAIGMQLEIITQSMV